MDLLAQGYSNYNRPEEFDVAIDQLIKENPTQDLAKESFTLGQGCWQVFYAPHISKLSSAMAARFEPIQYTLEGTKLLSNVKYAHPLLGEGWLSSGGM